MSARPFTESEYSFLAAHFQPKGDTRHKLLLVLEAPWGSGPPIPERRTQELLAMSARPLTESEYLTLLAHLHVKKMTRNAALLVVDCGTGYRIPELLFLTVGQLWTGTEVVREITISRRLMKGGAGAHKRSVRSPRGMDRPQAHRVLVSGCEACGVPSNRISTHTLRKTFAARIYGQTRCLITLQRLLGHRSPVTTACHLESDSAELDRLVLSVAA
jgi:integrase